MTHDAFVHTDVGYVREHNEDDNLLLPDQRVYVVADGMGGHVWGEVASRIAIESIGAFYRDAERTERLRSAYRAARRQGDPPCSIPFEQFRLKAAFEYGNQQIFLEATRDSRYENMGTTIVGLAFSGARVYVGHVGDSRAYRLRGDTLERLTVDHSLVNELISKDMLQLEDIPNFPYKNVIVRALGLQSEVSVDTSYRACRDGDRYLLCTDGLTDMVPDLEIHQLLKDISGARAATKELVARALDHGGLDNVTVMVVDLY